MKFNLLVLAVFVTLCSQCFGQERYIFSIIQYDPAIQPVKPENTVFKCYSTAITKKHLVIPAKCDEVQKPNALGVDVSVASTGGGGVSVSFGLSNNN